MPTDQEQTNQNSLLSKWLNRVKESHQPKGVQKRPTGVRVPLSQGQQRLLFLQQLYPENPFYHYAEAYRFEGNLDVERLLNCFKIVAERHDVFRTKVVLESGKAFLQVNDNPIFEIFEYDLRGEPANLREQTYLDLAGKDARKSLESPDGYLTRISIFRLKENEYSVVLTMHHMLTDNWSMQILQNEIAACYRKPTHGEEVDQLPLPIQYADYAYWQSLQKPSSENLAYWKKKLEDSLPFLDLPVDFPRSNRPSFRGSYSTRVFSSELSKKLKSFCKENKKTLFTVMLAAFKVLLRRYSGQTDILVGSPFTTRNETALENLIGFFDNTIVLRSDLSNDPTFIEFLEQVWQTTQEAFAHKDLPFEQVVKSVKPDRYLNHNPLFQVMFIYSDVPKMPSFGDNIIARHEPFDFGMTKFDLALFIIEDENNLKALFDYSKDLFDDQTVERMHGHLKELLEEIVKDPTRPISQLNLITDGEAKLFAEWNDTNFDSVDEKLITDLFAKQVASNPQKTALSFQKDKLTYEELNLRSNSVANYLLKLHLDKSSPIALLSEPSIDMVVGILGVLKAGFAYLPLDATYPQKRLDYILKNSSARVVLTQTHLSSLVSDNALNMQIIGELAASESSEEPFLPISIDGEDLAYVIYTSGSTGQPKGVCVTHNNLAYSTKARFSFYPTQPKSFLLMSSFSFDSSVAGIFWTLLAGGKLVLMERRTEQDLTSLGEIFLTEEITHTLLLPTLYKTFLKEFPKQIFGTVKTIIVAGEACTKDLCNEHFKILPDIELYNEYGPTEATVWSTVYRTTSAELSNVPIGKPISNTQVYILDENKNRVPVGIPGELFIGGKCVSKGYFNNADLTNKHFIRNNFNPEFSDKLYRTGDVGRYRSDGTIEFLGRKDNQVKLRGHRIELAEIEEVIRQNFMVREVVVKLETMKTADAGEKQPIEEKLLTGLDKMSFAEADEILKSVEKLSDQEIEFMLHQTGQTKILL